MTLFIIFIIFFAVIFFYVFSSLFLFLHYKRCAENSDFTKVRAEPFTGCLCLAAIVQSILRDMEFSEKIFTSVFGKRPQEYHTVLLAVNSAKSLNSDLLVENLVSIIKKKGEKFQHKFIPLFFATFSTCEFMWNEKTQGQKPSEYFSELVSHNFVSDEKAVAYRVLGISPKSSMEKVRKTYRRLAAKYHPDQNPAESSSEMFLKIQRAYEIIKSSN